MRPSNAVLAGLFLVGAASPQAGAYVAGASYRHHNAHSSSSSSGSGSGSSSSGGSGGGSQSSGASGAGSGSGVGSSVQSSFGAGGMFGGFHPQGASHFQQKQDTTGDGSTAPVNGSDHSGLAAGSGTQTAADAQSKKRCPTDPDCPDALPSANATFQAGSSGGGGSGGGFSGTVPMMGGSGSLGEGHSVASGSSGSSSGGSTASGNSSGSSSSGSGGSTGGGNLGDSGGIQKTKKQPKPTGSNE